MSQDTRKDPRAKVLTMTVRYKSATLDEFIEHHSYDVSRGGMFIKTPSPFPPGTLLKFEVKIAADQKVIQGVGRVVWKRDSENTADARPAGMGVKFIKIDDNSRKVIDTLVDSRGDTTSSAYDTGGGDTGELPGAAAAKSSGAEGPKAVNPRKATMIGLGSMNPATRAQAAGTPEKAAPAFFPETQSGVDMPAPEDRTVMRQAAELLQDALREAGGSMEEVRPSSKQAESPAKSAVPKAAAKEAAPSKQGSEPPSSKAAASAAKPVSVKPAIASAKPLASKSERPPTSAGAGKGITSPAPASRRVSVPVAATPARSSGGGGRVVVIALVIAATVGLVYAFSSSRPPEPAPAASAEPIPALVPSAAPAAVDSAPAAPADSGAPAESAAPSAIVAQPSSAAPTSLPVLPTPPAVAKPVPVFAKPAAKVAPVATPKPAAVPEPSEPSVPAPARPTEPKAQKPSAPPVPAVPAPRPPAVAKPKPKPAEPAGDNPY